MKNNNKKEITIDDLALMVAKGFDKMDEKMANGFRSVNGRLDGVEGRLDKIEVDVKDIKANLNKKVDKFTHIELEYRVEKLEKKFA